ncbi:hypothetical protein ES705_33689 [subsurface metagenome]
MENKERIEYLNKEILKREEGADWAWWILIATVIVTFIVALKEIL